MDQSTSASEPSRSDAAASVSEHLAGRRLAVAESCTAGLVSQAFASAEGSSEWFRGGVVAYMSEVKHELLGVSSEDVVTEAAAREMAEGVARVLGAEVALSTTGIAGPDPVDGKAPGTVIIGWTVDGATGACRLSLSGEPAEIIDQAATQAVRILDAQLQGVGPTTGEGHVVTG